MTFTAAVIQVFNISDPISKEVNELPGNGRKEEFDPSLSKLNSVNALTHYCDSLYEQQFAKTASKEFVRKYTELLSSVIRDRFYHGYSYYGLRTNYVATLFSKFTTDSYRAIVVPDDILKYPVAACSQQSIIMMEVLKKKHITSRKISFQGKKSGHFCFEVYYDNDWHFFDPDMEPDAVRLNAYNRPGIASLAANKDLLLSVYRNYPSSLILDVFSNYSYGPVNQFPAPRGIIFQRITLLLSYISWLFFLTAFLIVRRKLRRYSSFNYVRNRRVYLPQPERKGSSSYYPGITAPGS